MKRELTIIVEELRRLKREGVGSVSVSEETLQRLRERAAQPAEHSAAPAAEADPAPAPRARQPAETPDSGRLPDFVPSGPGKPPPPPKPPARKLPPPPKVELPAGDKQTRWEALRQQVLQCPTCSANVKPNCQVVFGVGDLDADIFFVGEAPGADEEIQGEPFVGKAGELLTRMIGAMGLSRSTVYIANIMNWRPDVPTPSGNRPPTQEEMEFCLPYLLAQIEIVQPKAIVALGNTAVSGLFGQDPKRRLRDLRGEWRDFRGTPAMVTYHPSYILRNGSNAVKRTVWEDLLQVMEKVGLPISEKQQQFFRPRSR